MADNKTSNPKNEVENKERLSSVSDSKVASSATEGSNPSPNITAKPSATRSGAAYSASAPDVSQSQTVATSAALEGILASLLQSQVERDERAERAL
jgi:hypothetical protein